MGRAGAYRSGAAHFRTPVSTSVAPRPARKPLGPYCFTHVTRDRELLCQTQRCGDGDGAPSAKARGDSFQSARAPSLPGGMTPPRTSRRPNGANPARGRRIVTRRVTASSSPCPSHVTPRFAFPHPRAEARLPSPGAALCVTHGASSTSRIDLSQSVRKRGPFAVALPGAVRRARADSPADPRGTYSRAARRRSIPARSRCDHSRAPPGESPLSPRKGVAHARRESLRLRCRG